MNAPHAIVLEQFNRELDPLTPSQRIRWALKNLPGPAMLSSSFGAQSAALLHLAMAVDPALDVVLIDTGYLFEETYRFIDQLSAQLGLQVHRYTPRERWPEARVTRLRDEGLAGIVAYNALHKIEPMQRALRERGVKLWISGLRRDQSQSRAQTPLLGFEDGRFKLSPIADWRDRDSGRYLAQHGLPYHPLWSQGYVSIGDRHLSRPLLDGEAAEVTRFFGLKRECGLHDRVLAVRA
jgi:phosphoadenosine phosphosulfate reductase